MVLLFMVKPPFISRSKRGFAGTGDRFLVETWKIIHILTPQIWNKVLRVK